MSHESDQRNPQIEQKPSRRTFFKVVTRVTVGLFSFVPAVKYLLDPQVALAYEPCSITRCIYLGQKCVPHPCGPSTIVKAWDCIDVHTSEHCYYRTEDTGKAC